jgi:tetratricopeptide (TPR) repeat protein
MKKPNPILLVVGLLGLLAAPALAGDYVKIRSPDGKISWQPSKEPANGRAPTAKELTDSGIVVTREDYDKVYYKYKDIAAQQSIDAASVVAVYYGDRPAARAEAEALMANGDYDKAAAQMESLSTNRTYPAWVRMYSLWDLGRIRQVIQGDNESAIQVWDRFEKDFPKGRFLPDVIINAGKAYLNLGKGAEARGKFLELEKLSGLPASKKMLARYYLIYITQKQGEASKNSALINKALQDYKSLLADVESTPELKDVAALARLGVGGCLVALEQYKDAQEYFQKIADSGTDSVVLAGAFNGLGRCLEAQQQWKDALLAFLRTAFLYNDRPDQTAFALLHAGRCYKLLRSGDDWKDRAKSLLQECMSKYPGTTYAQQAKEEYQGIH